MVNFDRKLESLLSSVVKIYSGIEPRTISSGSGFYVGSSKYILTCLHVVENMQAPEISTVDGFSSPVHIFASLPDKDIAILEVQYPSATQTAFDLGDIEDAGLGEELFVFGFPLIGDGITEQSPSAQSTRLSNKTSNYLKMSSPLGVGCSGGPVYHPRSKSVIGIAARELIQLLIQDERVLTGGTSFAIRIDHALPFLRKNSINFRFIPSYIKINQFREKVKAVYSSLGSKVIDKLGSGTQELDLLVTSQLAGSTINLGVFCILSQEIIGISDIENVYSKVQLFARASEIKIHKFVVVGSEEFSQEAKEFGAKFDIDLMTFSELSTKLINVQPYIHQLIQDYDQSKLGKYYIDAPCSLGHEKSSEVIDSVVGYVKDSFEKVGHKSIAVLGDFGMGKTSLAKRAAYEFALSYNRKEIGSRIPILIPLKEYKNIQKIQEAVQQILESKYGLQIPLNIMLSMQRSGQMVFILDGFDEMSDRVDLNMINENIRELLSLIEIENNRLLLTCRTHFFRDRVDEEKLQYFNIVYLIPWDEHQLVQYLRNRFPENWEHYLERIHNIFNLEELSQTPVFLEMIVESLPELENERDITSTTLYEIYTKKWILQQEIRRGAVLTRSEKENLLKHIAYQMLIKDELRLHADELNVFLRNDIGVTNDRLEGVSNDVRTCSFLIRDGDYYTFRHTSFMEFFVAKKYFDEIVSRKIHDFGTVHFEKEIFRFLLEMIKKGNNLPILHELVRTCPIARARNHICFILGMLGQESSRRVLADVLEQDQYSRVSGHAAEILYKNFGEKDAFKRYLDSLRIQPYQRDRNIPDEPNIGWYTVKAGREFSLQDIEAGRTFVQALYDDPFQDPNFRWYAASVLSRITNIGDFVDNEKINKIINLLLSDPLPRVRAYAAVILSNLGERRDAIIQGLQQASKEDEDVSVRKAATNALKILAK